MLFFKKNPAALRKDGFTQLINIVMIFSFAFFIAIVLPPIVANIGMGGLFFEDPEKQKLFNKSYEEVNSHHYFSYIEYIFISLFRHFSVMALIVTIIVILPLFVIIYLYFKLIFIDKFAPFFIHPKNIKRNIFHPIIKNYHEKGKDYFIGQVIYSVIAVVLLFSLLPLLYYSFWDFIVDYGYDLPLYILDITVKYFIPYLIIWSWLSTGITWKIIKESKPYRKLSSLGRPAARWGGVASYISHDFDDLIKRNKKKFDESTEHKNPIYLGTTTFTSDPKIGGRHFGLDTDSHMLTIAQTGSGKSRDVLHTNLAIWRHGLFVLDPKGEHAQRTYQLRKEAGFPIYIIDPYGLCSDIKETDCINLLEEIDPNAPSAADDIQTITYACIPPDAKEAGGSKHFRETAQMLFSGLVAHVLTRFPKEEQTLTTVFDLFLSGKPDGTLINQEGFYKILGEMAGNPSCGKLPMQAVAMLLNVPAGERGSIYSTFMRSVAWTQSESIKNVLSKSTFNLDEIRSNKATIYLVLPFDYMRPQARWIRAIIGLCFKRAAFPEKITEGAIQKSNNVTLPRVNFLTHCCQTYS